MSDCERDMAAALDRALDRIDALSKRVRIANEMANAIFAHQHSESAGATFSAWGRAVAAAEAYREASK